MVINNVEMILDVRKMRRREVKDNWNWDFLITSEHYSIHITGGSVKIYDRVTM